MRFLVVFAVLASLFLPGTLGGAGIRAPVRAPEDPGVTSWLSAGEARRLMRYHGVLGLKITADKVFIRRDGRWICVYHDPPYPLERSIASGSHHETVVASSEDP